MLQKTDESGGSTADPPDFREQLDEARMAALALELAVTGAIAREIVDGGLLGQSLEAAAAALSDRLSDLCERAA